jgi:hypothetical protein
MGPRIIRAMQVELEDAVDEEQDCREAKGMYKRNSTILGLAVVSWK